MQDQKPHPTFTREGDDLHVDITLSLKEALLGFARSLTHLDGRSVTVSADGVTAAGDVITVRQEGFPVRGTSHLHGDLHVHVSVEFPRRRLSPRQQNSACPVPLLLLGVVSFRHRLLLLLLLLLLLRLYPVQRKCSCERHLSRRMNE